MKTNEHKPNPPELILLKALWARGPMPVRALHDACAGALGWSFSSTRKTMSRMENKGFVRLDKGEGAARYAANISKTATLAKMTRDFMARVLEIDGPLPTSAFTDSKILTDEDLDELEGLLGSNRNK